MIKQALWDLIAENKSKDGFTEYIIPEVIFKCLLDAAINRIEYDEQFYLNDNSDVAEAVQKGVFRDGHDHYVRFGFNEDRPPRRIIVDEAFYRARYRDIAEAIDSGAFPSGQSHFDQAGFTEGRLPYKEFKLF